MAGFDTPFWRSELVGFFTWTGGLSTSLSRNLPWLFHACHKKQYRSFQRHNELFLRSTFNVTGGKDDCDTYECVWASLQPWHETHGHNHFGPFTVKMPLSVLDGRRFYVFERDLGEWRHYYLVQRETKVSLFGPKYRATPLSPSTLFQREGMRLNQRTQTQYEIVLTDPVDLSEARFIATEHCRCATGHCGGIGKSEAKQVLRETVCGELTRLARRFPQFKREIFASAT
jgi:hypothetical protein